MKKSTMLVSMLALASAAFAQTGRMSNSEALATKADDVIQKEYINVGKLNQLTISVETITDLTANQQLKALDLECPIEGDQMATVKTVLLDADELDGLVNYMQSLLDNYFKQPAPTNDKEFSFTSRSGFEAGAYWDKGWKVYFKLVPNDGRTNKEFSKDDVMAMLAFLKQAKSRM